MSLRTAYLDFRDRLRQSRAWRYLRPVTIFLLSVLLVAAVLFFGVRAVLHRYILPVDINDATPITVTVESNSSASTIAKLLYEAQAEGEGEGEQGLIANKAVFKIYVDFIGKAGKLKAGTYILSRNMSIGQIVDELCKGEAARPVVRFLVREGMSVLQIGESLVQQGVLADANEFYDLCRAGEQFTTYSFVAAAPSHPEQARDFVLEGYLFPDTYEVYRGSSALTVIHKMLFRFNEVFHEDYIERAEELGLTLDNVVSLASLIEKESRAEDFSKVSAVFHNRLKKGDLLGADASVQYIYQYTMQQDQTHVLELTAEQLQNPSRYNTRLYAGLPLGPIANPGKAAMEAALYPDEEYLEQGYYYFVLKSADSSELVFAITAAEHEKNKQAYRQTLEQPAASPLP